MTVDVPRCRWVNLKNPLYVSYHDHEWGVPVYDERELFELLSLEGAQAGLSWETVLNKREGYRDAFVGFDVDAVAAFGQTDVDRLVRNPGIVRHRLKIEAVISNARAIQVMRDSPEPFAEFVWSFVDGSPRANGYDHHNDIPTTTADSDGMSVALRRRGFKFVGPTICYAFMQAAGLVNDHTRDCYLFAGKSQTPNSTQ